MVSTGVARFLGQMAGNATAPGRARRVLTAVILLVAVLSAGPAQGTAAAEQRGVAVNVGRIDIDDPIDRGSRYALPPIEVRNPGELASSYRMVLQPIALTGDGQATPEEGWFTFTPALFDLEPDERMQVTIEMLVPADAMPGAYDALLSAQLVGDSEGARVGAAAAARLTFTIPELPPTSAAPWWLWWLLGAVMAVLLLLGLRRIGSRYSIQVRRR